MLETCKRTIEINNVTCIIQNLTPMNLTVFGMLIYCSLVHIINLSCTIPLYFTLGFNKHCINTVCKIIFISKYYRWQSEENTSHINGIFKYANKSSESALSGDDVIVLIARFCNQRKTWNSLRKPHSIQHIGEWNMYIYICQCIFP